MERKVFVRCLLLFKTDVTDVWILIQWNKTELTNEPTKTNVLQFKKTVKLQVVVSRETMRLYAVVVLLCT